MRGPPSVEWERVIARHVADGRVPGCVAAVIDGDREHVCVIGRLAVDGPPIRRDTIFRISSLTKPMVTAVALTLVEEGALGLDEPVDIWLPELSHPRVLRHLDGPLDDTVPARRAITVRDVLTYRMGSGLVLAAPHTYPIQDALAALGCGVAPFTVEVPEPGTWLRRLGALPLTDQPGETWRYDLAGDVLGVLLARASGQALPDLLRERLFEPLGMTATGFAVDPAALPRLAARYAHGPVAVDDGDRTCPPCSRPAPAGCSRPSTKCWPSHGCCAAAATRCCAQSRSRP